MCAGMGRRRREWTIADVRAAALGPTSLLVVDDIFALVTALAARYVSYTGLGRKLPVICAVSLASVEDELYGRPPGRVPLRGGVCDLFLSPRCDPAGETALDVVRWAEDGRYPLLQFVTYTAAADDSIEHLCQLRGATFVPAEQALPRQLLDRPSDAVRAALRGTIVRPDLRAIPVFDKNALFEDPEVLRYIEREIFGPWDELVLEGRRFALETAGDAGLDLTEGLLRTHDAILSGILDTDGVARARDLTENSARNELSVLRSILGTHEHRFARWVHRIRTLGTDPLAGDRWRPVPPPSAPAPKPRPSARRAR